MKYNGKCKGIDCCLMDEKGEFEVTIVLDRIPKQQLHLWKERLFENIEIEIESTE